MPRFNPKLPFGEIFGEDRAKYYQAGHHYDAHHNCLDGPNDEEEIEESPILNEDPPAEHEVGETGLALMEDEPVAPVASVAPTAEELDAMDWRKVKTHVEASGGTWTNKKDGIVFLTS